MPDALFDDSRFAALYDTFDGPRDDLDAYEAIIAEFAADSVLDIGCGTGSLAIRLAAAGRIVVGVDPAKASLDVARSKAGSERVTWVHSDAVDLPPLDADLAVMTGNVAQVFLTDDDWSETLHGIHRALRPGGYLVFETRRPERRAWEDWERRPPVTHDVPGIGWVEERFTLLGVDLPYVSFRHTYRFPNGEFIASDSTLRFRTRDEVESSLDGFRVLDVRDAPDRPGREYVFIAEARPSA